MKNTILFAMTLVSIFALFTACSKDMCTKKTTISNAQLLEGKNWYLVELNEYPGISDGKGGMITNIFSLIKDCDKDNFQHYQTDGTLVDDQGLINCSSIPQKTNRSWKLENNETTIAKGESAESKFQIVSIDEKNLKLKDIVIDKGVIIQTVYYSYISK
jgi:hypothetical protein